MDLCSGKDNYFLQYELVDKNGNVVASDVFDEIEDFEIVDNKDTYVVHFDIYDSVVG